LNDLFKKITYICEIIKRVTNRENSKMKSEEIEYHFPDVRKMINKTM